MLLKFSREQPTRQQELLTYDSQRVRLETKFTS